MPSKRSTAEPVVVLVGRPNVGKSTLFNRIIGSRRAIVAPVPGTTRDQIAQATEWRGTQFELIDTGGMFGASSDPLHELVVAHGRRALDQADLVVFLTDGREGVTPADEEIASTIRRLGVPVILAVNKTDDRRARDRAMEFHRLGFEPVLEVAGEHGLGVGELLDEVVARLPAPSGAAAGEPRPATPETQVAVVGRPNVGKSSLVNRLLREERMMVSDMPGTTRDSVDTVLRWHRRQFRIVDTAGIRRPGRVARAGQVEAVSVLAARRAIESSQVAVLLVDATEGATDQDAAIAGEAERAGCGVLIAANKWDLVKGRGPAFVTEFDEELWRQIKFLDYAPLLHVSAASGERVFKVLETIDRVAAARARRIPTGELNRFIEAVTAVHPPAGPRHRHARILYAAQTGTAPPTFVFFTTNVTRFHFSYERFLANRIREAFGFEGTPIRIEVRTRRRA